MWKGKNYFFFRILWQFSRRREKKGGGVDVGVCVCVCVFSSHSFVGRTSRGHTGFLIHLLSAVRAIIFSREGFSHSFPSSTVKSNCVY